MQQSLEKDVTARWSARRGRAAELAERWSFAGEVLTFYGKLLAVQERAFVAALADAPDPAGVAAYAVREVLPGVVEVSVAEGPASMTAGVLSAFDRVDAAGTLAAWLRGEELAAYERYLARAAATPVLEALAAAGKSLERAGPEDDRHCPVCGGLPQVGYFASSPEDLVTAHRYLECARCATAWAFSRMTCAGCGELETARLDVYGEEGTSQAELSGKLIKSDPANKVVGVQAARFPHVRVDGCRSCARYSMTIDLVRDARAVPAVDELGALPLDLYAKERGLTKIVPNVMGF
ncbi:MAG: formate dehydrogenase accessory protein FdhE [Candidatus Eremiobacteraeota bacterium]|nr:formate dehydrogenase accessory protein FdhE [Candidatus Eremiobacteraeota bacterium]